MYALARNAWKFHRRDKRARKLQNIEFDAFAPDSVEEIIEARRLLLQKIGAAALRNERAPNVEITSSDNKSLFGNGELENSKLEQRGKAVVSDHSITPEELKVFGLNMEKSRRPVVILKSVEAYHAYGEMLLYYAVKNLIKYLQANPEQDFDSMKDTLSGERQTEWVNIGGQLMRTQDFDQLRAEIGSGSLKSWDEIHAQYDHLWEAYPLEKQRHAFAVLQYMYDGRELSPAGWKDALERCKTIQEYVRDKVYSSRNKDFENPFRQATYRSLEEMTATIGTIEDNSFIQQVRDETNELTHVIAKLLKF